LHLKIHIPNNFFNERSYVVEQLFSEFLNYSVNIQKHSEEYICIQLENGKKILLYDYFFNLIPASETYLNPKYLPTAYSDFFIEQLNVSIPVFYGKKLIQFDDQTIHCHIDCIAMVFFLLSRMEEYIIPSADMHGRFLAKDSFAGKNNILHRPLVDELVVFIDRLLEGIGLKRIIKKPIPPIIVSVDIDQPYYWRNHRSILTYFIRLVRRKEPIKLLPSMLISYYKTLINKTNDPYFAFEELFNLLKNEDVKLELTFMTDFSTKYDISYRVNEPYLQEIIYLADKNNIPIGIHPSYASVDSDKLLEKQIKKFKLYFNKPPDYSRQHFLRINIPNTFKELSSLGIQFDSTLYFAEEAGFRCGTSRDFYIFDCINRCKLEIKERPFILMDVTAFLYKKLTPHDFLQLLIQLYETIHSMGGNYRILWHNSNIRPIEWQPYWQVFTQFLKDIKHDK